jgi:hypothetical protein
MAKKLAACDAVKVGVAGTFIVRKPGSRASVIAELRRKLPFEAGIAFCDGSDGSDLLRLEKENPSGHNTKLEDNTFSAADPARLSSNRRNQPGRRSGGRRLSAIRTTVRGAGYNLEWRSA